MLKERCQVARRAKKTKMEVSVRSPSSSSSSTPARWRERLSCWVVSTTRASRARGSRSAMGSSASSITTRLPA
jgi:hypothetical protein